MTIALGALLDKTESDLNALTHLFAKFATAPASLPRTLGQDVFGPQIVTDPNRLQESYRTMVTQALGTRFQTTLDLIEESNIHMRILDNVQLRLDADDPFQSTVAQYRQEREDLKKAMIRVAESQYDDLNEYAIGDNAQGRVVMATFSKSGMALGGLNFDIEHETLGSERRYLTKYNTMATTDMNIVRSRIAFAQAAQAFPALSDKVAAIRNGEDNMAERIMRAQGMLATAREKHDHLQIMQARGISSTIN